MFKKSRLDFLLTLLALVQVCLLILPFVTEVSTLSLVLLVALNVFLIGTNYQCVAHNFIHHPFFKNSALNKLFSIINSVCIGIPQSLYRIHHLDHHRFNNHPEKDKSSTYMYGKEGKEENIFLYSFLGILRSDLVGLYQAARKQSPLVLIETLGILLFVIVLTYLNWKLTIAYIGSSYLLGQVFALWENYCEHHHAQYSDKSRDSVSCYNSFYNFIWFNNGYHQEHHLAPQVHWTEIKSVTARLPSDRVIVKFCHLANSFGKKN